MRLRQLIGEIPRLNPGDLPDLQIEGVTSDSRRVARGHLFVAIRGAQQDGHRYLGEAAGAGAAALVGEPPDDHHGRACTQRSRQDVRGRSGRYLLTSDPTRELVL